MFADIVSYSRMMGVNEKEALKLLADFDKLSIPVIEKFNGELIKKNGDELFCEFNSAKHAVDASIEIQNALASYNDSRPKDFKLEVRIGVHIGDVVKKDDDIFGDGVNVASRIQPLAAPGGICISGAVSDALSSHPDYNIVSKGKQELKHIVQQHSIFELKTGHERRIDTLSANSSIASKVNNPFIFIPIMLIFLIGGYFGYSYYFNKSDLISNKYYFHITSNENGIKYYQNKTINSSPYENYYLSNKYSISTLDDSLISEIKKSVFSNLSSYYVNQDIRIGMSFSKEEINVLDKLYHPRIRLIDTQKDSLSKIIDDIVLVLDKKYDDYNGELPNTITRYYIFKVKDFVEKREFLILERAGSWGESMRTNSATEYVNWELKYILNNEGINNLIDRISSDAKDKIYEKVYGSIIGLVIEELDHNLVRIKQYHPGTVQKKMKLGSMREYTWADGGVEILIDDYNLFIEYFKNTDLKVIWNYYNADSIDVKIYNPIDFQEDINSAIEDLISGKNNIEDRKKSGYYEESIGMNTNDWAYYLEVTAIEDSIVIAKIVDSKRPVYKVREGDWIYISK
jgi:class 3 adenylate cyclase